MAERSHRTIVPITRLLNIPPPKKKTTTIIKQNKISNYLDLVYTYKSIVNNTDTQFKTSKPVRVTRRTASSKSVLLDVPKAKTVTFQNSFYSRASRAFNTLPEYLRDNTQSISVFKTNLRKHYLNLTLTVYDPAVPQL